MFYEGDPWRLQFITYISAPKWPWLRHQAHDKDERAEPHPLTIRLWARKYSFSNIHWFVNKHVDLMLTLEKLLYLFL